MCTHRRIALFCNVYLLCNGMWTGVGEFPSAGPVHRYATYTRIAGKGRMPQIPHKLRGGVGARKPGLGVGQVDDGFRSALLHFQCRQPTARDVLIFFFLFYPRLSFHRRSRCGRCGRYGLRGREKHRRPPYTYEREPHRMSPLS